MLWENAGYRDTWVEVNLNSIVHNIKSLQKRLQPSTNLMAVVKADGYGHGAAEIARTALQAGAQYLGVAIVDEALQLNQAGIAAPILVLGYTPVRSVRVALIHDVTLTVYTLDVLQEISFQAKELNKIVRIHLKVDTGMGRIGVTTEREVMEIVRFADADPYIELEGIFTHFADADSLQSSYTEEQFFRFLEVLDFIQRDGYDIPIKHCCNSAATIRYPGMHLNMVRVGIAMYGLYPDPTMREEYELRQVISLKTRIASLKCIQKAQAVSYGSTFVSERVSMIATLPIGYADGLSRSLSNRGRTEVRGKYAPIIGRICMDQTMIDVTDIEGCKPGEEVTLIGDRKELPTVDELAELVGTINYEVVCLIGKRVPRIYLSDYLVQNG
ncbi:alanine racemase [Paenibacillus sp. 7124]|uniref:Alanine racemase n=1 Tax=Paenibacillus apii TaxID=1850370 RepID=A0A6M1PRR8_9BACL|nr:alanine racemase [Paenibacillus apii]NGM85258.1 alanine racemase [Paenibacillus apii]